MGALKEETGKFRNDKKRCVTLQRAHNNMFTHVARAWCSDACPPAATLVCLTALLMSMQPAPPNPPSTFPTHVDWLMYASMTGSLRPTHTNDAPSHPTARMKHQPSPPALLDGTGLLQMPLQRAQSPEAMQDNRSNWDHMRYTRSHKRQHEPNETPRHSATHTHLRGSSNAPLTALDPPISLPQTSAAIGVHFQPKPEAEGPTETKLSALRDSDPPSCPPFGVRQTKLSALRDSDPQVVRPSRFLSCPPFGIQITKLSALRGSSDHQVVRPPGFRSPSCPPSGVCHCLRLPAQCGARQDSGPGRCGGAQNA